MKKLSLKASCLCSGVKFTTKGNHRDVQNCHCIQCMKTHGHHAAYTNVEEQNIKFIKKSTLKWFRSSKRAKRGFCSKCGASIFFKVIGTKNITPYWRTLKSDGKINLKYPGGIPYQRKKLINENHKITKRGKNHFVENFENKLVKL